jgi:hypothetical protein
VVAIGVGTQIASGAAGGGARTAIVPWRKSVIAVALIDRKSTIESLATPEGFSLSSSASP